MVSSPPRIGFSGCFFHADPKRPIFKGKTLVYAEESMLKWAMLSGALPVLLPRPDGPFGYEELIASCDGLLLQGGSDVSPKSYNEEPLRPEWAGDYQRDCYEIGLIKAALAARVPVLGVCRGAQILNVALGGTLYQDLETQLQGSLVHRDWDVYDSLAHDIDIIPDRTLGRWYGGKARGRVNSVHHQAICEVAPALVVEARSVKDGVIEAVSLKSDDHSGFAVGIQWHPEFIADNDDEQLVDPQVIMDGFIEVVKSTRDQKTLESK